MHLEFSYKVAWSVGEQRHAEQVMRDLGITWGRSTPQTMDEAWWFWNCENVPADLPPYVRKSETDPYEAVGCGFTYEMADEVLAKAKEMRRKR